MTGGKDVKKGQGKELGAGMTGHLGFYNNKVHILDVNAGGKSLCSFFLVTRRGTLWP